MTTDDLKATGERLRAARELREATGRLRTLWAEGGTLDAAYGTNLSLHGQRTFVSFDAEALARAYLADRPADDGEPVTVESEAWLRAMGGLPNDPQPGRPVELGWTIWERGVTESYGTEPGMHLLWSSEDNSWWLESYDTGGETLAIVELEPRPTRGDVRRLFAALGIKVPA